MRPVLEELESRLVMDAAPVSPFAQLASLTGNLQQLAPFVEAIGAIAQNGQLLAQISGTAINAMGSVVQLISPSLSVSQALSLQVGFLQLEANLQTLQSADVALLSFVASNPFGVMGMGGNAQGENGNGQ